MINADTSFSDPTAPDNRGVAVFEVLIYGATLPSDEAAAPRPLAAAAMASRARVQGSLPDGRRVDYETTSEELIGRCTDLGWWVVAKLPAANDAGRGGAAGDCCSDGSFSYLLVRARGRRIDQRVASGVEIRRELPFLQ